MGGWMKFHNQAVSYIKCNLGGPFKISCVPGGCMACGTMHCRNQAHHVPEQLIGLVSMIPSHSQKI